MKAASKIFLVGSVMAVLLVVTVTVFFWAFGAQGNEIPPLTAELTELRGEVQASANPREQLAPAVDGMTLEAGGQVITGSTGRARVDLSSGTIIRVSENTVFEMESLENTDDGPFARLKVGAGEIWVILSGGSLEADTPSGIASVRGSYMSVAIDQELGEAFVTCLEGNCMMETPAGMLSMIAGETATVKDLLLLPEHGYMTRAMVNYWVENNPESTQILSAATATVRASLPEVVLPDLACLDDNSCVSYCLPGDWDISSGKIPAMNQIPNDCIEGLFSFVWQGVNPETFFVCLAAGGGPQACANNSVRRVFPITLKDGEQSKVNVPELSCLATDSCASYCVPRGWNPNSGQMPSLGDIPVDCLLAANSLLNQEVDPWLFMQCVYVYGDVAGCAEAAVAE